MLEPTHGPTVSVPLRVEPSNLQPNLSRLPGRAFLSACRLYPVFCPYLPCRVLSCVVFSLYCVCVCGLSPLPSCSFVRSVPCTATNQTAAVPFPPLLPRLRTLSLSPHKSRPIDFSPAASQPASPVQPSHWKPSLLSQLISQLSQLDAKPQPSSRQPSSPSLLLPSSASPRSQKQGPRSRSRSTPSTPRDLEATDIQRAKEQRQIVVIYWTCPPALAHRHHLAQRGDNPFRSTSFSACLNCLLAFLARLSTNRRASLSQDPSSLRPFIALSSLLPPTTIPFSLAFTNFFIPACRSTPAF